MVPVQLEISIYWMLNGRKQLIFINMGLSFGLRYALQVFSVDLKEILKGHHFLGDYIFLWQVIQIHAATLKTSTLLNVFAKLGIPVEQSKLEDSSFLGQKVATQLRVPNHKLAYLMEILEICIKNKALRKKQWSLSSPSTVCH